MKISDLFKKSGSKSKQGAESPKSRWNWDDLFMESPDALFDAGLIEDTDDLTGDDDSRIISNTTSDYFLALKSDIPQTMLSKFHSKAKPAFVKDISCHPAEIMYKLQNSDGKTRFYRKEIFNRGYKAMNLLGEKNLKFKADMNKSPDDINFAFIEGNSLVFSVPDTKVLDQEHLHNVPYKQFKLLRKQNQDKDERTICDILLKKYKKTE